MNDRKKGNGGVNIEELAAALAEQMGFELVEASLVKESRGKVISVFIDKEGGITLDDCEKYHKLLQPAFDHIDYDIMEVSSPGVDRPIKTMRDFEKNRGSMVEVHLFAPVDGSRLYNGTLESMDGETVGIRLTPATEPRLFPRKAVSLIKPMIDFSDEDFADVDFGVFPEIEIQSDMENKE